MTELLRERSLRCPSVHAGIRRAAYGDMSVIDVLAEAVVGLSEDRERLLQLRVTSAEHRSFSITVPADDD